MRVAGTGHRPDKLFERGYQDYADWGASRLADLARAALSRLDGVTQVASGMALGWDQALAEAALDLDIPLIAAIPFVGQEKRWSEGQQLAYHQLLRQASEVVEVSPPGYAGWKMQARNVWMLDHCELLLALHDGSPGGTGNCLVAASARPHIRVINLWQSWLRGRDRGRAGA